MEAGPQTRPFAESPKHYSRGLKRSLGGLAHKHTNNITENFKRLRTKYMAITKIYDVQNENVAGMTKPRPQAHEMVCGKHRLPRAATQAKSALRR